MKVSTVRLAAIVILVLATAGCASPRPPSLETENRDEPWQYSASARTRADHELLASWYEREADAAAAKAAAHRWLRDASAASSRDGERPAGFSEHCNKLVREYEQAEDSSRALAELHRALAGNAAE